MSRLLDMLYVILLVIGSPWLLYRAIFKNRNRRGWSQKLWGFAPADNPNHPCVWMHAVSVGEVNLLAPVIKRLQRTRPELEIVISTTTETGFDLACGRYANHQVFFCPLDFSWAIQRTLKSLNPELIVLAELEIWPNLISIADSKNIPVAIINGRLSQASFQGYRRFYWLLRPTFERLAFVVAANDQYAERFTQMGVAASRVSVTGNIKFDGVTTKRDCPEFDAITKLAGFDADAFVWVAGSTQPEEDLLAAKVYRQLSGEFPQLRLVLVPRHPETADASAAEITKLGVEVKRRSMPDRGGVLSGDVSPVFMVDVIGELTGWWSRANVAYVGGSMGKRGGQNMIEPAAFGIPVSFGPNTRNFRAIVGLLLENDGANVVRDSDELAAFVRRSMNDPIWATEIGQTARELVLQNAGAADRTVDALLSLLPNPHRQRDAA